MELKDERWLVRVTKRKPLPTGEPDTFTGTCRDDGLQSLYSVHVLDSEEVRYASVLDTIHWLARMDTLADLPKQPSR